MSGSNSDYSRRKFLSTSVGLLAGAGVAGLAPGIAIGQEEKKVEKPEGKIIYRKLGKTGVEVPIVSMGVMNANNPEIVAASYDLGVRHFDTAARYQYGRNEQMVGNVIKKLGIRDKVQIATKEWRPAERTATTEKQVKDKFIELVEASLKRLKTDYADIVYVHSVTSAEEVNDTGLMEAFTTLKQQGKVRFAGVSTHQNMADVLKQVTKTGFYDVVLTSINVTMAGDTELLGAIKAAADKGVGIVAMKTQAGGSRLPNPETLKNYSTSTIQMASLRWVMRNESIATSIPGYDNFEHMNEDFSIARSLEYTDEEENFLSDNSITLSMGFCRQCKSCLATCPHNTDIPTLMRTHMYAAQYANFHHARATLEDIPKGQGLSECTSCTECSASCANTVDIPRRISELKAMYA